MTGSQPLSPPLNTKKTGDHGRDDGLGRTYSYLQTPVEYHAPTFPSSEQTHARPDGLPNVTESPSTSPTANTGNDNANSDPRHFSHMPFVNSPSSPSQNAPPDPANPPPLSAHPANFAPYAEPSPNPPGRSSTPVRYPEPSHSVPQTTSQPAQNNQPSAAEAQQRREKEWAVVPDDNPLASPTAASTFAPNSQTGNQHLGTQPASHQSMSHLPGQVIHPSQQIRGGVWSHSLCDCSDASVCCTGFWCPCILYGRTQYRLSMKSDKKDPTNLLGYETCNAPCTGMALLCGCQWLLATIQHVRTRRAYGITGGAASDCIRATCCTCCTLIQDEREIKLREEAARSGGLPGGAAPAGYTPPMQMSFNPPPR